MAELQETVGDCSIEQWLLQGGLPRIFNANQDPTQTYRNYLKTYIERDLRQLINLHNMEAFQTFIRLCAARIGQLVNFNSLASEVGISHTTKGQHEVDLLYQMGGQCLPIEIKNSQTFKKQYLKGLEYFQSLFPNQTKTGYLIYAGEHEQSLHNIQLIHFTHSAKILNQTN